MPPRGRPTLVVLSLVTSSSVASLSSASFCDDAAACRSLVLTASCAFRRSSALLAAYPGPSKKKERKKTDNPREGWENGTPPAHRDFLARRVYRPRIHGIFFFAVSMADSSSSSSGSAGASRKRGRGTARTRGEESCCLICLQPYALGSGRKSDALNSCKASDSSREGGPGRRGDYGLPTLRE